METRIDGDSGGDCYAWGFGVAAGCACPDSGVGFGFGFGLGLAASARRRPWTGLCLGIGLRFATAVAGAICLAHSCRSPPAEGCAAPVLCPGHGPSRGSYPVAETGLG